MKKLFRHTDKTVQREEYGDGLLGWDGMEEAIEENAEYGEYEEGGECEESTESVEYYVGEGAEFAGTDEAGEYYAGEGEEYYAEEGGEYYIGEEAENYTGGDEEYYAEETGEYYVEEEAENSTGENVEYYTGEEAEYYSGEENPEEGYIEEVNIEPEYAETEEDEELAGLEEFEESGEFTGSEEVEGALEFAGTDETGEYYAGEDEEYYAEETGEYYVGEEAENYTDENVGYYAGEEAEYYSGEENPEEEYTEEKYTEEENMEPAYAEAGEPYTESLFWEENSAGSYGQGKTGRRKKRRGSSGTLELIDRVMLGTGAAVLILALVTGTALVNRRVKADQVADFAGVGAQLEGISIIGEKGLAAVADAEIAKMAAAVLTEVDEGKKEYDETAYDRQVSIAPIFTSVHKDLKIKFINQKTGKLVPNVPFSVTITDPDGKSIVWSDDDMDGIIYKKDIAAGNYRVTMETLEDPRYSDYAVSAVTQTAAVQEEIVYQPVDVANEVKTEAEVNVAQEDTRTNETVVESILTDTVAWVESKVIGITYNEIARSEIPDPAAIAMGRILMATVEESGIAGDASDPTPDGTSEPEHDPTQDAASDITPEPASNAEPEPEPDPVPEPEPDFDGTLTLDRPSATVLLTVPVVLNAAVDGGQSAPGTVTAESSNTEVAQVSVSGWAVTVTGVGEGSAEIIVRYSEDGGEDEAVCTVTVKKHPREDTGSKLKDAAGNQLYVLENDVYREASYADYYQAERFFLRGGARYSGWQTIEGKIYYFTADGVKVTGEQIIQGAGYQFADDGALVTGDGAIGIDVSKWNGTVDWNAVKNSGISYVIIRSGYRGSSTGKLIEDPYFETNLKGALAAGLKVGIYFYSQAIDEIEAVEEASMVLEQIKNYQITYPVFIDVERSGGRGDKIDNNTRTAVCKAFCQTIQNAGYTAGIYSNKLWMEQQVNMAELNAYKVWLAQYAAAPTYSGKYDIWQYKANGSVSGVNGNVDLNISYLEN